MADLKYKVTKQHGYIMVMLKENLMKMKNYL